MNKILATNIKKLRLKNELSQKDLAALIDSNQSLISAWERRAKEPDKEFVDKISHVFGIPAEILYNNEIYPYLEIVKSGRKDMLVDRLIDRPNKKKEQETPKPDTTTVPTVNTVTANNTNSTDSDINNRITIDISNVPKETKNTILKMIDAATPIPYGETVLRFVNEFLLPKTMFDSDIVIVNKIREVLLEKTYSTVMISVVDLRTTEKKAKSFQIITNNNISKNIYSIEERLAEYNCNSDFFHVSYDLKKSKADRYFFNIILLMC